MKIKRIVLTVMAVGLMAGGAATEEPKTKEVELAPPPPPYIPVRNEANVIIPGQVKAYAIDRYPDPVDPNIMHERHVVYRRESEDQWRLKTSADRQILVGNTMTDGKLDGGGKMNQELAVELDRQRAATYAVHQSAGKLLKAMDNTTVEQAQLMGKQAELKAQIDMIREQLDRLEKKIASTELSNVGTNAPPKGVSGKSPPGQVDDKGQLR